MQSAKPVISNFKSEISNHGLSCGGFIFGRRVQLPEIGIRSRKRDAGLNSSAVLRAQKNDAAVLLSLCQLIGEQQHLSLVDRNAQQQQGAIRIHVQRVRFFMERFFLRPVAVHVHGDVQRPAAASPPVGNFSSVRRGRFRRCFALAQQLCVSQRFKNSAHFHITARLVGQYEDKSTLNAWRKGR